MSGHELLPQMMLVVIALVGCAAFLVSKGQRDPRESSSAVKPSTNPLRARIALALLLLVAGGFAAWTSWSYASSRIASHEALRAEIPNRRLESPDPTSPAYVSSDRCQTCHPRQFASWHETYHRTMTQKAEPEAILGRFDGRVLSARGRHYTLERRGDEYWVEMADPDWERDLLDAGRRPEAETSPPMRWKRIVMATGSHHMQTYWVASERDGRLFNFPWLWLVEDARWIPREEGFIRPPAGPRTFDIWHGACIECHSVAGEKNHRRTGSRAGRWDPEVAELGIACEACHGPAGEHARAHRNPLRRYWMRISGEPDPTIVNPARLDAEASSQVCGHCHGINLFKEHIRRKGARYQPGEDLRATRIISRISEKSKREASHPDPKRAEDWRLMQQHFARMLKRDRSFLRDRFWPDGMIRVSGREHNSFIESACFEGGELSCLSCHSMHASEPNDQLAERALGHDGDDACLQCHDAYAADVEAHTFHDPTSSGSRCANCHMPHTVYGLLKNIRSHWIDSPSATTTVQTGRPSACELCHLDRSLGWVADHLEARYGQPQPEMSSDERSVASGVRWLLTGNAQQRALVAWHMGWPGAEQAVSRRGDDPLGTASPPDWRAYFLGYLLDDPYPAVRYLADRSLRRLQEGASLEYDFLAPASERARVSDRVMQAVRPRAVSGDALWSTDGLALLRTGEGEIDREAFDRLAAMRDDQPMDLRE